MFGWQVRADWRRLPGFVDSGARRRVGCTRPGGKVNLQHGVTHERPYTHHNNQDRSPRGQWDGCDQGRSRHDGRRLHAGERRERGGRGRRCLLRHWSRRTRIQRNRRRWLSGLSGRRPGRCYRLPNERSAGRHSRYVRADRRGCRRQLRLGGCRQRRKPGRISIDRRAGRGRRTMRGAQTPGKAAACRGTRSGGLTCQGRSLSRLAQHLLPRPHGWQADEVPRAAARLHARREPPGGRPKFARELQAARSRGCPGDYRQGWTRSLLHRRHSQCAGIRHPEQRRSAFRARPRRVRPIRMGRRPGVLLLRSHCQGSPVRVRRYHLSDDPAHSRRCRRPRIVAQLR